MAFRGAGVVLAFFFEQKLRQIEDTKSSYTKEQLEKRLAKLVGGVALIKVREAKPIDSCSTFVV